MDTQVLLEKLYTAFQAKDGQTMTACYHPEARFSDPVFTDLRGADVGRMWRMLCGRSQDLRVEFSAIRADAGRGQAHWEAWYTFSRTGRPVHNIIDAEFEFRDGLILRHTDRFDLHRWAGQALGLTGKLLGGTALIQNKVRRTAAESLAGFTG